MEFDSLHKIMLRPFTVLDFKYCNDKLKQTFHLNDIGLLRTLQLSYRKLI